MNIQQILGSAFLGIFFTLHGTVYGVPISTQIAELANIFAEKSHTLAPTKTAINDNILKFLDISTAQRNNLQRRAPPSNSQPLIVYHTPAQRTPVTVPNTVTNTVTNEVVEEVRQNPVGFLRGLAEKFRGSYQWVKTSKGWEWIQRQGTKVGELMKKAWNWFNRVILRKNTAHDPQIIIDGSHLQDPVTDFSATEDTPTHRGEGKAIIVPTLETIQEEAEEEGGPSPPSSDNRALVLLAPQNIQTEPEEHETKSSRNKGKGKEVILPAAPAQKDIQKEADVPILTQEEHARLEMEDEPGYGDIPGPSNYREKAWEKYNTYIRPAIAGAIPAIFEFEPESEPASVDQVLEHNSKVDPVTDQSQALLPNVKVTEQAPVTKAVASAYEPSEPTSNSGPELEAHSQPDSDTLSPFEDSTADTNMKLAIVSQGHVKPEPDAAILAQLQEPQPVTEVALQNTNGNTVHTGPAVGQDKGVVEENGKLYEIDFYGHSGRLQHEDVPAQGKSPMVTVDQNTKPKVFGPQNRPGWMTPPEKNLGFPDWPGKHECVTCKSGNPGKKVYPWPIRKDDPEPPRNPDPGWWEWLTTFGRGYQIEGPQPYDPNVHYYDAYKVERPDPFTYAPTPTMNPLPPVDPNDEGYNPWDPKPLHPLKVQSWREIQESAKAEAKSGVTKFPKPANWGFGKCDRNKCSLRNFNGDLVELPSRPDWALHRFSDTNFLELITDMGQYEQACKQLETEQRIMAGLRPLRYSDYCSPV
ncbi:hypothetical protein L211DRAFT_139263 [Terfezia boudieri ATCC MYA-4762]|uniref:Uncharacterized protein n=1 Tax=Terfezia boudieri ATCC MYA-4762 TaxID=1051890 RepID=A0A3N4LQE2_9PEZI|nr:hypothetical protein L211DRAFT_139263 [Terfezia boudieri ATCC MYA-4762]